MKLSTEGTVLKLERVFVAERKKVWNAFTSPELFIQWWGPKGWVTTVKEFSFAEGGVNHYGMKCEDPEQGEWYGQVSWGKMVFSNIQPIESFDYTDYFVDEEAQIQDGMPVSETTLQFVEEDGATRLISTTNFESEDALKAVMDMGMLEGITQTWDRLEELVETQ